MTHAVKYVPVPRAAIEPGDAHWLFQELASHVQSLLEPDWHPLENVERLHGVPARVKVAWYLWWFACEVAGNGFIGYLANGNSSVAQIQNARRCLREVGDTGMLEALDAGIALSKPFGPDFWNERTAQEAFGQFKSVRWSSLEELDSLAMGLACEPLEVRVQKYLLEVEEQL